MSTFITGGTGYLGGYVVDRLLRTQPQEKLALLVRCNSEEEAREKLWRALQCHRTETEFWDDLGRIQFVPGDLHAPNLGIEDSRLQDTAENTRSIIHIAASLNRKSERACLNTNLRGTLSTARFARMAKAAGGLDRFSHVSTVAVAGERNNETVQEDLSIDWNRRDYDPYARTKKFAEHMVRELLDDVRLTFLRPSIVLGDSEKHTTTQFDMIRAVSVLAELPLIPLRPDWRMDIVPANYVAEAIVRVHTDSAPEHAIYHLSSGTGAPTVQDIARAIERAQPGRRLRFAPRLEKAFELSFEAMDRSPRALGVRGVGALMKVFWPYVTFNTVFDNRRIVAAMDGRTPASFPDYVGPLLKFSKNHGFKFPFAPLREQQEKIKTAGRISEPRTSL